MYDFVRLLLRHGFVAMVSIIRADDATVVTAPSAAPSHLLVVHFELKLDRHQERRTAEDTITMQSSSP